MPATSVPRGSSGSMRALFRSSSAEVEVVDHVTFSSGVGDGGFDVVGEGGFGGVGGLAGSAGLDRVGGLGGVGGFFFPRVEVAVGFFGEGCLSCLEVAGEVLVDWSVSIGETSKTVVSFAEEDSVEMSCLPSSLACRLGPGLMGDSLGGL